MVEGDSVATFPADSARPGFRKEVDQQLSSAGTAFILFSAGVRIGTLAVAATGVDSSYCAPRPSVSGVVELVPGAADAQHFLALPTSVAGRRPYRPYQDLHHTYDQRVASLTMAAAAIPKLGATWPTSVLGARADIQAFQVADTDAFAATFLFRDHLDTSPPEAGAYSLFIMGMSTPGGYQQSYLAYRPAADQGKGDPRYFDHLDWNGDGRQEILLDVFGANSRWFAGLGRRGGSWVQTFQDRCGEPGTGH